MDDRWPKQKTCAHCGKFGPVWWWHTKPYGYVCAICADPKGYAEFCKGLLKARREYDIRREREAKKMHGMHYQNTTIATIYPCKVCGISGQQGYAGMPPCYEGWAGDAESHKRHREDLRRRGCVRGLALHTCCNPQP